MFYDIVFPIRVFFNTSNDDNGDERFQDDPAHDIGDV